MIRAGLSAGAVIIGLVLLVPGFAGAFSVADIAIHGFLSQGYLKSSDYDYLGAETEDGTFAFTEAAVNFNAEPVDRLRIGLQLFSRDLGEQGNFDLELDWAVADYRMYDWLGLRLGKVKMPLGLYNHLRDADMARNTVFLPSFAMYPESFRDVINAFSGADIYGDVELGTGGTLEYEVFGGQHDLDDSYGVRSNIESQAGGVQAPLPLSNTATTVHDVDVSNEYVYGAALRWNTPLRGLLLSGTFMSQKTEFSASTTISGWMDTVPVSLTVRSKSEYRQPYTWVASASYEWQKFRLTAEYWRQKAELKTEVSGLPFPVPAEPADEKTAEAYYVQAAYRVTDRTHVGALYSVFYGDVDDRDGDDLVNDYDAWLKDFAVSARFDINSHWLVKLEGHFFNGTGSHGISLVDWPRGDGDEDWTLFAVKSTVYF